MLRYTAENLFVSPAQTLVNTINTVGVMGKGIALEFKRRYPSMFERYRGFCNDGSLTIGKLYLYKSPNKWVLNFPTKKHWRGPSKIEWIETGLQHFAETYESRGITSIAFPQLGCGNGGLPWEQVRPLMQRYLEPLPLPVYIHTRDNPPGFVTEHERKGDISAFCEPRAQIGFEQFLSDLQRLAGGEVIAPYGDDGDAPEPLPNVALASGLTMRGDDLEYLWHRLYQCGALSLHELPGSLAESAESVADVLLELDYIRSMTFVDAERSVPTAVRGLRLSPPPRASDGPLFPHNVTIAQAILQ